jgi:hypothetical protein
LFLQPAKTNPETTTRTPTAARHRHLFGYFRHQCLVAQIAAAAAAAVLAPSI